MILFIVQSVELGFHLRYRLACSITTQISTINVLRYDLLSTTAEKIGMACIDQMTVFFKEVQKCRLMIHASLEFTTIFKL